MSRRQCQRHVPPIRASHNTAPSRVDPLVFLQMFQTLNLVLGILTAPVSIDHLHVPHTITSASANIRHEDRETVQGKVLNQGHREPGKIGAFLALRPAMYIEHYRPGTRV